MRLVFTKRAAKLDDLLITRDDGTVERVACPKQGIIPHDMVHFAVETTLRQPGYFAQVAERRSGYRMTSNELHDAVERLVETMQAELWSGRTDAQQLIALYEKACTARGHAAQPVTTSMIEAIRVALDDLGGRWEALDVNASLELELPSLGCKETSENL